MKETYFTPRVSLLILAVTVLAGIALRFYHLNFQSLWYDELHSIIPSDPANSIFSLIEYCKADQPPFSFIYLHYFFHLFGYNEVTGRMACAFLGVAAIPVMYLLGKEIEGRSVGLFAALLTSLNYMHIYYSQELRFYSMAFLLTAVSFHFLLRAFKGARLVDFVLYTLFTTALLYTHYYGLVIYGVQAIAFLVLLIYRRDKKFLIGSIVSGILILVLFIPWLPVILSDLKISTFWIKEPSPIFVAEYFYYYFGKDTLVSGVFIFLLILFFKFQIGRSKLQGDQSAVHMTLMVWLIFSYLIPYVKSVVGPPMLHVRYTIVSLPVWFLIFSSGWGHIKNLKLKYAIVVVVSLSMFLNLIFIRKHYVKIDKQQFREVSSLVKTRNEGRLPIYSAFPWHFNFYFRDYPVKPRELKLTNLVQVDNFWLLHAEFFSANEKADIINSLERNFEIIERYPFHKTEALLMKRVKK